MFLVICTSDISTGPEISSFSTLGEAQNYAAMRKRMGGYNSNNYHYRYNSISIAVLISEIK